MRKGRDDVKRMDGKRRVRAMPYVRTVLFALCLVGFGVLTALAAALDCYLEPQAAVERRVFDVQLYRDWERVNEILRRGTDGASELQYLPGNLCYQAVRADGAVILTSASAASGWTARVTVELDTAVVSGDTETPVTLRVGVVQDLQSDDVYAVLYGAVRVLYGGRIAFPLAALLAAAAVLVCIVQLRADAGRDPEGATHARGFSRIPADLLAAGVFLLASLTVSCPDWSMSMNGRYVCLALLLCIDFAVALALPVTIAVRVRSGTLLRNTVIFRVGRGLVRAVRWLYGAIPAAPAAAGTLALLAVCNAALVGHTDRTTMAWILIGEAAVLIPLALYFGGQQRKIHEIIAQIAADPNAPVDVSGLAAPYRAAGASLAHIRDGIADAVAAQLRSERFKTELITNVSHDLKTPLTSIINYTDLLGREPAGSAAAAEYVAVLSRQSIRLKKLIEDLIEASKAATGNLPVHWADCAVGVLLRQAAGEYADRLAAAQLEPVLELPEAELMIRADSRHLGRMLDNLLQNICKYAHPGTRVYISAAQTNSGVEMLFRNVSRDRIAQDAAVLTERFVRGDSARTSEGSGLGLAIVRSLAELQGGRLEITVDGDLFRARLIFPAA